MRQRILFAALALLLLAPAAARAQADTDEHTNEVGAFYTGVNLQGFGETVNGLGARFGHNINKHLSIDAEGSFFPETHLGNDQVGQKAEGFVGVKAGARVGRFGFFAKARPGVISIGELTSGFDCSRRSSVTRCTLDHNNFAFDAGGVLELYPTSRAILRFDAGDTIVRIHHTAANSNPLVLPGIAHATTHNFQFSVGFGYRF